MKKSLLFILLMAGTWAAWSQDYLITRYGVKTDSAILQTKAIQSVIDTAEEHGGGTIVVPKGVYLTGALFFKPGTRLVLQEGAVLKGSDNIADYPLIPSRMEGHNLLYYAALINAYYVDSFSITGPGMINGNGLTFWKAFWSHVAAMRKAHKPWTNLEVHRPRLVFLWGCNHATIRNVKLHNSGFWTTHLYQCHDVLIEGCDIRSPFSPVRAPSTDGVDIDVCSKVTIRDCYISVNDDAIAIKGGKGPNAREERQNGPVEDILIENCDFGDSHGSLTLGSEAIHANHITFRNCKVNNHVAILRMKMRPDTYQTYENITVEGITGRCGSLVALAPWRQFFDLKGSDKKPFAVVRHISFSNINVICDQIGSIKGNPADKISDITFKHVTLKATKPALAMGDYPGITVEASTVNGKPWVLK